MGAVDAELLKQYGTLANTINQLRGLSALVTLVYPQQEAPLLGNQDRPRRITTRSSKRAAPKIKNGEAERAFVKLSADGLLVCDSEEVAKQLADGANQSIGAIVREYLSDDLQILTEFAEGDPIDSDVCGNSRARIRRANDLSYVANANTITPTTDGMLSISCKGCEHIARGIKIRIDDVLAPLRVERIKAALADLHKIALKL